MMARVLSPALVIERFEGRSMNQQKRSWIQYHELQKNR